MVLLILQDGSIEGALLPLLWGQSNLTAEPPEEEDKLGTGMDLRAQEALSRPPRMPMRQEGDAPVGCLLKAQAALLHLPLELG